MLFTEVNIICCGPWTECCYKDLYLFYLLVRSIPMFILTSCYFKNSYEKSYYFLTVVKYLSKNLYLKKISIIS